MGVRVFQAAVTDVDAVAPLFDAYRQFYGQPPDLAGAREFLAERLRAGQSVVFLAVEETSPTPALGFVQLYPSFSSVRLRSIWVLNDLFVAEGPGGAGWPAC